MDVRVAAGVGIAVSVLFVLLGVVGVLPWQSAGTLAATVIGVVSVVLAVERRETGRGETCKLEQSKLESEEGLLWEESILVSKKSCSYYNFTVGENEKVAGEILSEDYFNVYFATPRNFARYEAGEDFKHEYGTEHASKIKINFVPSKPGKFYCMIQNASKADIDVNVTLRRSKIQPQR
jgi:hypothetical protein